MSGEGRGDNRTPLEYRIIIMFLWKNTFLFFRITFVEEIIFEIREPKMDILKSIHEN